jgi:hypothetical protein
VQSAGKLARDVQGHAIAHSGRTADFNKARNCILWNAEGDTAGTAHQDLSRVCAYNDYRGAVGIGTKIGADKFDFAQG